MELIDTHAHIHFEKYGLDPDEVIKRAKEYDVKKIICVGCSVEDSVKAVNFAEKYPNVWATVGAHPHDGQDFLKDSKSGLETLAKLSKHQKVVAIGEIGLDYFHTHSTKEDQIEVLRLQLEMGLKTNKPFIFHIREAWDDFWPIVDSFPKVQGVVHSFTAGEKELDEILKRGFYVSLNGIMTFTKNQEQLAAAKKIPLDKLLLETDAPFLTPAPLRGKICESYHIRVIAEFISNLMNVSLEQLASSTTRNAVRLFSLNN